jgi:hypothetical protein
VDWYLSQDGDLKVSPNRDIALTDTDWRDDAQQAYIRIMTEPGDFLIYPTLGANLSRLYGMPQSTQTGELGKAIIREALERENRFQGKGLVYKAVPISEQTIRFDVYIVSGVRDQLILSIEQNLGVV